MHAGMHTHTHTRARVHTHARARAHTHTQHTELRLDGTNLVTKTSRMSLGRVSVVRAPDSTSTVGVKGAEQRLACTPMIDDYIKTPEQVCQQCMHTHTHQHTHAYMCACAQIHFRRIHAYVCTHTYASAPLIVAFFGACTPLSIAVCVPSAFLSLFLSLSLSLSPSLSLARARPFLPVRTVSGRVV